MPCAIASPNPLPPAAFVVKKGSKTRRATARGIPTPVSVTSIRATVSWACPTIDRLPPVGIASRALRTRSISTSRSSDGAAARMSPSWMSTWTSDRRAVRPCGLLPAPPGQFHHVLDGAGNVGDRDLAVGARLRELLDSFHHRGAVFGSQLDQPQCIRQAPVLDLAALDLGSGDLSPPEHGRQQVVDAVGDAGCHLAAARATFRPAPGAHRRGGALSRRGARSAFRHRRGQPATRSPRVDGAGRRSLLSSSHSPTPTSIGRILSPACSVAPLSDRASGADAPSRTAEMPPTGR